MPISAVALVNKLDKKFDKVTDRIASKLPTIGLELAQTLKEVLQDLGDLAQVELDQLLQGLEKLAQTTDRKIMQLAREIPDKIADQLAEIAAEASQELVKGMDALVKLLHLCYLATGNQTILNYNLLFYAVKLSSRREAGIKEPLYTLAALARLQQRPEQPQEAHAIAAYGLRQLLPVKPLKEASLKEKPEIWAHALRASYAHDIEAKINGELLTAWGITEAFAELEEEEEP